MCIRDRAIYGVKSEVIRVQNRRMMVRGGWREALGMVFAWKRFECNTGEGWVAAA